MNLGDIIVLALVAVGVIAAITFIVKNGGFSAGCDGNCAACQSRCKDAAKDTNNK